MIQANRRIVIGLPGTNIATSSTNTSVRFSSRSNSPSPSTLSESKVVNPKDGTELDSTSEIVKMCNGQKSAIDSYFETKEESIKNNYRELSNSAAAAGTPASLMQSFIDDRDKMLSELNHMKDDVLDLSDIPASETSVSSSNSGSNPTSTTNTLGVGSSSSNSNSTGGSSGAQSNIVGTSNDSSSTSDNRSVQNDQPFRQDSSEVYSTDFSSSDY